MAKLGAGLVSPNPMVGAVIVHNNIIIGEGYHQLYGGAHAEVNAINSVTDKSLLAHSTIYVSLEPCSHFGKTPPCADLIIQHKIPHVVIATLDTNKTVCGNGVSKLKNAGIKVEIGVLENESNQLNKAFNKLQSKKRPFVILKWAETADGFMDHHRTEEKPNALKISNSTSSTWVHKLRSETDAILVGKTTVLKDNPTLNTRKWAGKNPLRVVIDPHLETINHDLKIYDQSIPTLVFNSLKSSTENNIQFIKITPGETFLTELLDHLGQLNIQSILVEGGAITLQKFINANLYDECYIIKSTANINSGIDAPKMKSSKYSIFNLGTDIVLKYQ